MRPVAWAALARIFRLLHIGDLGVAGAAGPVELIAQFVLGCRAAGAEQVAHRKDLALVAGSHVLPPYWVLVVNATNVHLS